MKKNTSRFLAAALAAAMALSLAACSSGSSSSGSGSQSGSQSSSTSGSVSGSTSGGTSSSGSQSSGSGSVSQPAGGDTFTIGICNYVDDASLNQIVENIETRLDSIEEERGVTIEVETQNSNGDAAVMNQIISDFIADGVDLMVGVATPVATAMQAATEDSQIPVVFSAVSDPVGAKLVESMEAPGANITGTSDYLDTEAIMNLVFAADPETDLVGLLYDLGQDSSTAAIASAKEFLDGKGIAYKEYNGSNTSEITLAVESMVSDGVDAVFTPSDNTVMTAELAIYESLIDAGIKQYGGADSFALNGAFVGYGVDYANLGQETANMIASILLDGADPASTPVMTFDNGIATVNTETCEALGLDFDTIEAAFEPLCSKVATITTAEEFES